MTDKNIINAISKTYFILISFLSFIFLVLFSLFVILQNGLYIEKISVRNITLNQLYIKWNEKIDLSLKELVIQDDKKNSIDIDYKEIHKYFSKLPLFNNTFEKINIETISFDDKNASFSYIQEERGFFTLTSETLFLESSFTFEQDFFHIDIKRFSDTKKKIEISAEGALDLKEINFSSIVHLNINQNIMMKIFINTNDTELFYKVESKKKIEHLAHTINMLDPDKDLRYWILDAIKMKYAHVEKMYGFLEYNKMHDAYKNLYAKISLEKLQYKYNPALDAVNSSATVLEFRDGVLFIKPQNPSSYGQNLGKSWLKIDFTQAEELLTLHLLFDGVVNHDILNILKTYEIKLPFVQKNGLVSSDLQLAVNLRNLDTEANGRFDVKKANFDYLGLNLDVQDAHVKIDNYDVTIERMSAHYKDILSAHVQMHYNAKENFGAIDFVAQKIKLDDLELMIDKKNPNTLRYQISDKGDFIRFGASSWNYKGDTIKVDAIALPFDLESMKLQLPPTQVTFGSVASLYVDGPIDIKKASADLMIDLLFLSYKDIKLAQSSAQLKLKYADTIELSSKDTVLFALKNTDMTMSGFSAQLDAKKIKIENALLDFNDDLEIKLSGEYQLQNLKSKLIVDSINFKNPMMQDFFRVDEKFQFELLIDTKNNYIIDSKELQTYFILNDKGWSAKFDSIKNLKKYSKMLQDYNITSANGVISKSSASEFVTIDANITQPHKVLLKDNIPTDEYFLTGRYNTKSQKTKLLINDTVDIFLGNRTIIKAKDCGINIDALIELMSESNASEKANKTNLVFNATNSYLYLNENRRVISESIDLQYLNNIVTAQLKHKKAKAGFKLSEKTFHLYGANFNNEFMENLFSLSKFKGGTLDFSMNGKLDDYDGVFYIKDTTIMEYKMLNNILAFINTVPSFITFSLPSYNTSGLYTKVAYLSFKSKDDVFYLNDIYLDSEEVDIFGRGVASIKTNSVDIKLNLKTNIGSSVSKIPLIGYLLFDKESVSTSLNITGELSDPDVDSLLPSEIIVAPLNLIKRTLLLPKYLLESDEKK